MHDFVLRISKNLWASHITLWSSSLRLFRNGCLPPKIIMYLAVVCIKENMSGLNVRCADIERFQNVGKALPQDIGLSWLLKCVVWISFCPAVSFSRSKRYRCTEISADIDVDRPGTNSLYEGTHINTCHGCQLSWTIYMILYDVKKLFWQVRCQYDDQKKVKRRILPE